MQISFSAEVEQPPNTQSVYQLRYLDNNNIGAQGCRHLCQSKWNKLQTLNLGISYGI